MGQCGGTLPHFKVLPFLLQEFTLSVCPVPTWHILRAPQSQACFPFPLEGAQFGGREAKAVQLAGVQGRPLPYY